MNLELIKRILSSIVLIPLALFFIIEGSFLFNLFIFICLIIALYEWYTMTRNKSYNVPGIFFLILSFWTIYKLRNDFDQGYTFLLFVAIICVATDVGGYMFGKIFKGPKITRISPKKTYSGMIGGYLLSILAINLLFSVLTSNIQSDVKLMIFFYVLLISTVSQLGDILISYFKRISKIKDTGNIIPGHGGILDRIDGMIFAFPFSYLISILNLFEYF